MLTIDTAKGESLTATELFEVIELDDLLELAKNTVNVCV